MAWIEDVLKSEYSLVKVLKKTDTKTLILFRHKASGKNVVCRKFKGDCEVYKRLEKIIAPNLPQVYGIFEGDEGFWVVLEEYVDGVTVGDVLATGLYNENGVRAVAVGVCDGLGVLHRMGIVHRDIKPENIMITNNGVVKVIDFDAARIFKQGKSADTKVMGTVGYAAPEQMGLAQSDERTDIFALGILVNVMLTGEHPGKRMYKGKLSRVIEKSTRIDPLKRFSDVSQLKKNL